MDGLAQAGVCARLKQQVGDVIVCSRSNFCDTLASVKPRGVVCKRSSGQNRENSNVYDNKARPAKPLEQDKILLI